MILFSTHRFDMVEKLCSRVRDPVGRTRGRRTVGCRSSIATGSRSLEDTFVRVTQQADYAPVARQILDDDPRLTCRIAATSAWYLLTRHFFGALFDLGFLSDAAAESFKRMIIGICASFLAFGLMLVRVSAASTPPGDARTRRSRTGGRSWPIMPSSSRCRCGSWRS